MTLRTALSEDREVRVGRHPDCAVRIDSATISQRHCRFWIKSMNAGSDALPGSYRSHQCPISSVIIAEDDSTNGTFVNGVRLERKKVG